MNTGSRMWNSDDNLYLIGFMASGKTTVGRKLAEKSHRRFFDTDEIIAMKAGQSIAEIFTERGEADFRQVESEVVAEVTKERKAIVALGGGAILLQQNWLTLDKTGITIYLKWDLAAILPRLVSNGLRPLIYGNHNSKRRRIEELFRSREGLYERARYTVACHEPMTPEHVSERILEILGYNQ